MVTETKRYRPARYHKYRKSGVANVLGMIAAFIAAAALAMLAFVAQAVVNAVCVWIILDVLGKSVGFWGYIWIGTALVLITYPGKD